MSTDVPNEAIRRVITDLQALWLEKGLPDRVDLARVMTEAAEPWISGAESPRLIQDLVWLLSGVAYKFTEAPLLLERELFESPG